MGRGQSSETQFQEVMGGRRGRLKPPPPGRWGPFTEEVEELLAAIAITSDEARQGVTTGLPDPVMEATKRVKSICIESGRDQILGTNRFHEVLDAANEVGAFSAMVYAARAIAAADLITDEDFEMSVSKCRHLLGWEHPLLTSRPRA